MAPLIVLLVSWPLVRLIGFAWSWRGADSWSGALRFAFAFMFFLPPGRIVIRALAVLLKNL
jgi:hypothetical protein